MRFLNHYRDSVNSQGPAETPKDSILKNRFFRNILLLFIIIAIALISYNTFLITPSFTKLLIVTSHIIPT